MKLAERANKDLRQAGLQDRGAANIANDLRDFSSCIPFGFGGGVFFGHNDIPSYRVGITNYSKFKRFWPTGAEKWVQIRLVAMLQWSFIGDGARALSRQLKVRLVEP
jgi:hypothetical protein